MMARFVVSPLRKGSAYAKLHLPGELTSQGSAEIKEVGKRIESFRQLLGSKGGKLIAEYATLGRYDYVIIVDLPSDQAALEVSVTTGKQGNVAFETCRAFPIEEFIQTAYRM